MSALAPCPACQNGDHEHHVEHWMKAPEGVLGGAHCACTGDCKAPDLSRIFGLPMTARPDVPDTPDRTDAADVVCDAFNEWPAYWACRCGAFGTTTRHELAEKALSLHGLAAHERTTP